MFRFDAMEHEEYLCIHVSCGQQPIGSYIYRDEGIGQRVGWRLDRCCATHASAHLQALTERSEPQSDPQWIPGTLGAALAAIELRYDGEQDWFVSAARPPASPSP